MAEVVEPMAWLADRAAFGLEARVANALYMCFEPLSPFPWTQSWRVRR